jgi:hypothetical protein
MSSITHYNYPVSAYHQILSSQVTNLEESLQRWDEALERIHKLVGDAHEVGIEFDIEMKNIVWHVNNLNKEILKELEKARSKFQESLDYIQSTNTMVGK